MSLQNLSIGDMSKLIALCILIGYYHLTNSSSEKQLCDKPEGSCLCYQELEASLLATENNTIHLSKAFFPLEDNPPEFVTVTYYFNSSNATKVWFWSTQTSCFLHPFEVFHFSSLFFSKPDCFHSLSSMPREGILQHYVTHTLQRPILRNH